MFYSGHPATEQKVVWTFGNNVINTYSGLSLPKNAQLDAMERQNQGNGVGNEGTALWGRTQKVSG